MGKRALLLILATPICLQLRAEGLGLGDLIGLAEKSNLGLTEGRIALDVARAGVTVSRSALLPKLSIEYSANYASQSDTWNSQAGLVLRQNFYDGGQSWSALESSRIARARAEIEEKRARETMSLAVLKSFAAASRLERNRVASSRKLGLLEQQFNLARSQYRQGRKTQQDYQLLEAELERSRLEVDSVDNELFAAYRNLEKTVGNPEVVFDVSKLEMLTAEKILSLKQWFEESAYDPAAESLELKSEKLAVDESQLSVDLIRKQYWPVLGVNASATYGSSSLIGPGASSWGDHDGFNLGVGLQLNWTLWDWGGVPAQVARAKANEVLETKRFEQRKLDLVNDYRALSDNLRRQGHVLEVQQKIRGLERKSFQQIDQEYREGRSTYLELITALERDIQAELSFENEVFAYFVSLAEVLELKGNLYDHAKTL
ncbi:MAG: TolC family protein [Bdellovibrionota bacterium]